MPPCAPELQREKAQHSLTPLPQISITVGIVSPSTSIIRVEIATILPGIGQAQHECQWGGWTMKHAQGERTRKASIHC